MLVKGFEEIKALDSENVIDDKYRDKWNWVKKTDFLDEWKASGDDERVHDDYEKAVELAELMTTLDYMERPMAKELLEHGFFEKI